ncbi:MULTISPECIES: GNAT family N-acetyltransferase [unclassified Kitasatospora]|uniref:GNAT family N-acetyltransferase n=1 Tax=unclassified Kitasatospora TaxID=2633591 RepID=UPI00071053F8|nr:MULTISPECIES: GNAT family N-acetyltransferase [unclassified Kitasatospora]KQV09851.1 acetyltransferase [Kitasatospora sp. Root107]KRB70091.1 acetyltransferase [Kitasatospora sp. Root187]
MEIRTTGYGHPDAEKLAAEVQQEYVQRYGGADETVMHPDHFESPAGLFVVGYLDEVPVACGGWRVKQAGPDDVRDGDAELKRMYVSASARGRGLARTVLRHLEQAAAEAGLTRMILETGTEQPEAIALYGSEGYLPITKFGFYRDSPESLCFGKQIG